MSQKTMKKIGAALRNAREDLDLTQAEVAKRAGMGKNRYAVIEQGNAKNMTINKLEEIVKALNIKGKDIIPF